MRLALSLNYGDPVTLAEAALISALLVGDCETKIEIADQAVTLNPNSYRAWICRSWVYKVAGQPEEAIRSFERAMRMSPVDPQLTALTGMGFSFIELRRFDEAIIAGKKALRHSPWLPGPYRCLASAFVISDATPRPVRRRLVCLRTTRLTQYRLGSLGAGHQ
jgi:tetratricopeptide (TPR) repeat protein